MNEAIIGATIKDVDEKSDVDRNMDQSRDHRDGVMLASCAWYLSC